MIVDASALIAVILKEPGYERLLQKLAQSSETGIGAPTLLETFLVLASRLDTDVERLLEAFLELFLIDVIPFDEKHRREAARAFLQFGKGRHAAGLNYGDCMAFATAKLAERPLLFVGNDFPQTDLESAL
ncbi:MAG: type II toxin-antitoxin system VapC family toxin [bacterium]|nr:type II toxin-antitoxin system VapC family toxin [bacterium]